MTTSDKSPVVSLDPADRPVFKCHVDAAGCRFDLRLNDVPIYTHSVSLPLAAEFPVSESMLDGENDLTLFVQPPAVRADDGTELYGEEVYDPRDSAITVSLIVKPAGGDAAARHVITTLSFQPGAADSTAASSSAGRFDSRRAFEPVTDPRQPADVQVSTCQTDRDDEVAGFWITRYVTLPCPYPRWAWLDAEALEDGAATRDALVTEVRRVWEQVRSGDVKGIETLLRRKVDELASAYWLETRSARRDVEILPYLMQSEDLTLEPLPDDFVLDVFADGRLARLLDATGEAPLLFTNADGVGYYFNLTFCRLAGEWVVIR